MFKIKIIFLPEFIIYKEFITGFYTLFRRGLRLIKVLKSFELCLWYYMCMYYRKSLLNKIRINCILIRYW